MEQRNTKLKWIVMLAVAMPLYANAQEKVIEGTVAEKLTTYFMGIFAKVQEEQKTWLTKLSPKIEGSLTNLAKPTLSARAVAEVNQTAWGNKHADFEVGMKFDGKAETDKAGKPVLLKSKAESALTTIALDMKLTALDAGEAGAVSETILALNYGAVKFVDESCTEKAIARTKDSEQKALREVICPGMLKIQKVKTLKEFYTEFSPINKSVVAELKAVDSPFNPLKDAKWIFTEPTNGVITWGVQLSQATELDARSELSLVGGKFLITLSDKVMQAEVSADLRHGTVVYAQIAQVYEQEGMRVAMADEETKAQMVKSISGTALEIKKWLVDKPAPKAKVTQNVAEGEKSVTVAQADFAGTDVLLIEQFYKK